MTHFTVEVRDEATGALSRVLIVDDEARRVWSVLLAGGDPEPMSPAGLAQVEELDLTSAGDLAGAEMSNSLAQLTEPQQQPSREHALQHADQLLFAAQQGREPRPDVPPDLAFGIRELESAVGQAEEAIQSALRRLRQVHENLASSLTRRINLPDRHAPAAGSGPEADPLRPYHSVLALLAQTEADTNQGKRLSDMALKPRTQSALEAAGVINLDQLVRLTRSEVLGLPDIGTSALQDIEQVLGLEKRSLAGQGPRRRAAQASTSRQARNKDPLRLSGRVASVKGSFAFIAPDDGSEHVFLHAREVPAPGLGELRAGQRLEFKTNPGKRGPRREASDVKLLAE